jgi:hypothetical protein
MLQVVHRQVDAIQAGLGIDRADLNPRLVRTRNAGEGIVAGKIRG